MNVRFTPKSRHPSAPLERDMVNTLDLTLYRGLSFVTARRFFEFLILPGAPSNDMWKITPRALAVRGGADEDSQ